MTSNTFEMVFSIRRIDKSHLRKISNTKFELKCHPKKPARLLKTTNFVYISCYLTIRQSSTSHMRKITLKIENWRKIWRSFYPLSCISEVKNYQKKPFASIKPRYNSPSIIWFLNQDVSNSLHWPQTILKWSFQFGELINLICVNCPTPNLNWTVILTKQSGSKTQHFL